MKIPFPKYEAEVVEEIEAYLDMHYQTEIVQEGEDRLGLKYLLARGFRPASDGRPGTRRMNNYARPMFDVISDGGGLSGAAEPVTPCQCYRFDQSWACSEHPEISWDPVRRRWDRPCTGDRTWCECTPCHERRQRAAERSNGYTDMGTDGLRPPVGLYDRLIEMFGRELPRPSPGFTIRPADRREFDLSQYTWTPPPLDPNRNRPGYHYDFATDRWVPDVRRRLDALPDASLTLTGTFTLEITGDTTQAAASTERDGAPFRHTVRIEVERNGDTP